MRKYFLPVLLVGVFLLLAMVVPKTDAETVCLSFLQECGWETEGNVVEEQVTLPTETDATWDMYLAMQRENGFDLAPYGGEEVLRLRFTVTNHPSGSPVYANVYWYKGEIIGGDIMHPSVSGFMHGLRITKF